MKEKKLTLKEFREITKDFPEELKIIKWNTNYGYTHLHEVILMESKEDGTQWIELS